MFTETQEKEISDYGRKKPCHLNVVISLTGRVKSHCSPPRKQKQQQNQTKKKPNKTKTNPFEKSVSWDNIQQQMFQHKHVYQISDYISSPEVTTWKGFQRQGDVSPTIKALIWEGRFGNGVKEGGGSHWITGDRKCTQVSKWSTDEVEGTRVIWRRSQILTALEFVGFLSIGGWWDADVDDVVARRLIVRRPVGDLLLRHDAVDFCKESTRVRAPGARPPTGHSAEQTVQEHVRTQ